MLKLEIKPGHIIVWVLLIAILFASYGYVFIMTSDENYFRLPLQDLPTVEWCKKLKRISEPRNPVGLVSASGCGNTWLRFLLQQATGIPTGSIYNNTYRCMEGFPGEIYHDGSVLVVKNHYSVKATSRIVQFDSIVLLIRNPRDSILATYNFKYARMIENKSESTPFGFTNYYNIVAPPSVFKKFNNYWSTLVPYLLREWTKLYTDWLTNYHGPIHVVFYENLINNTRYELQGILDFLNVTVTENDITCAIEKQNDLDDIYRHLKKYKYFDPFTKDMYRNLELAKNKVYDLVRK